MSSVDTVAALSLAAAETIGRNEGDFAALGADFVLRNLAVATDRLSPEQFAALPPTVRDQVIVVAHVATDLRPLDDRDQVARVNETDEEYDYRVGVWQPIHALQAAVCALDREAADTQTTTQVSKLRFATHAAGLAFAGLVQEAADVPEIRRTLGYFASNARAAARQAARVSEQD